MAAEHNIYFKKAGQCMWDLIQINYSFCSTEVMDEEANKSVTVAQESGHLQPCLP